MLDTNNFNYADSIWQDIFLHLKNNHFDVYPPGVKLGECVKEYIVVKNNGSARHTSFSSDIDYYSIMCYVPKQKYSMLESYVQSVKRCMKMIEPLVRSAGSQTPSYYDDGVKAHMISIEYLNYKKI